MGNLPKTKFIFDLFIRVSTSDGFKIIADTRETNVDLDCFSFNGSSLKVPNDDVLLCFLPINIDDTRAEEIINKLKQTVSLFANL